MRVPRLLAAALRRLRRHRHGAGLRRRHRAARRRGARGHRLAGARLRHLPDLPPPPGPRPDLDGQGRHPGARSSTTRPSTSRSSSPWTARSYPEGAMATAIKVAARRRRGIHVLVTIPVPRLRADRRRAARARAAAPRPIIEQAKLQGGRRVTGHWEKVRAGGAGRLIVEEARAMGAKAIVMPLPARAGGDGVQQDGRDRARRAAVPGHHPGRPGEGPRARRPSPPASRRSIRTCPTHATSIVAPHGSCPP